MKDLELYKAQLELEQAMKQINTEDTKAFALRGFGDEVKPEGQIYTPNLISTRQTA
jgi:hypothetical protein